MKTAGSSFCLLLAAGCGSALATHPTLPLVQNAGGTVLQSPVLIAVTFTGDPLLTSVDDFVAKLPGSSYWQLTAEYGVGQGRAGAPIQSTLALKPTMDDSDWQAMLPVQFEQRQNGFSPPVPEAIYVLFAPPGVQVTAQGQTGCVDFGGYHSAVKLSDGTQVAYAVVARCSSFNGLSTLDSLTGVASHEVLEAASDPYFSLQDAAWSDVDSADYAFSVAFGGEIADLCINSAPAFFTPADLPYVVQRIWSNAAARRSQDPCLPASDAGPYVQAAPELSLLPFTLSGASAQVHALSIPVGGSATVQLDLFSAPATAIPWGVSVLPIGDGIVNWTLTDGGGIDGSHFSLTLSVASPGTQAGISGQSELVAVVSQLGDREAAWPILITTP